jgi:carbon-monoxide dehydrogenase medium subunit
MKNAPFIYHRPENLDETLTLLADFGADAKVLAGGQSLLPTLALRLGPPEHLVDIARLSGLDAIDEHADGSVTIGALVRHAAAEHSEVVAQKAPLVAKAMPHVGHRAIRTRGTVVGSIAHADPAAEMPAVALSTAAVIHAASKNSTRDIAAADFFEGYLTTSLRDDELVTGVTFPAWSPTSGSALVEVARRHGDYAMVGVACTLDVHSDVIASVALSFFGVGARPVRAIDAEAALLGQPATPATFDAAADIVRNNLATSADLHATANYRRHVASVLTRRGLDAATVSIGVPA